MHVPRTPIAVAAFLLFIAVSAYAQNETAPTLGLGGAFGCAISNGALFCWGRDRDGELGDNQPGFGSPEPRKVVLPEKVVGVSTGGHACAWAASGRLWCWGESTHGQLGPLGPQSGIAGPTQVEALLVESVAAGASHTCAIQQGEVWCWGANFAGQLGNGLQGTMDSRQPAASKVKGLGGVATAISAGSWHTCALLAGGTVRCWGENTFLQLGTNVGDVSPRNPVTLVPVTVPLGEPATSVSVGIHHTCATLASGAVSCWGHNGYGQGGGATATERQAPQTVLTGAVGVAAGGFHACALLAGGAVECWGANFQGQLGISTESAEVSPDPVVAVAGEAAALATGGTSTCVRMQKGDVRCWGYDGEGGLGDGTLGGYSAVPRKVLASGLADIDAGSSHACGVRVDGEVLCWGSNWFGVLGTDDRYESWRPQPARLSTHADAAVSVHVGTRHSCAMHLDGALQCWGSNTYGVLGNPMGGAGDREPVWVTLPGLSQPSAGGDHMCALSAGAAFCWGDGGHGQLGTGVLVEGGTPTPQPVSTALPLSGIESGYRHSCGIADGGKTYCWGDNLFGQLGLGGEVAADRRTSPTLVPGLPPIAKVAVGGFQSCALSVDGTLYCWGLIGGLTPAPQPTAMTSFTPPIAEVAIGGTHYCVRSTAGTVECAGQNDFGQAGNPLSPIAVPGAAFRVSLPFPAEQLAAGHDFTCARLQTGEGYCWGANPNGELGSGEAARRSAKKIVDGLPMFLDGFD